MKSILIAIGLYCLLSLHCTSNAKIAILSFDEKVELSDIIVHCKTLDVQKKIIGKDYAIVEVIQTIKGKIEEKKIKIKYGNTFLKDKNQRDRFVPGQTYILFLVRDKQKLCILGGFQGFYSITGDDQVCEFKDRKVRLDDFIKQIQSFL